MQPKVSMVYFAGVFLAAVVLFTITMFAYSDDNLAIQPGTTVGGLRMEARVLLIENDGEKQLIIRAYLINEGADEATVLTKDLETSMSRVAAGRLVVGFNFTGRQEHEGRLIIPSLYAHDPVMLRTEEVAMLTARHTSERLLGSLQEGQTIRVGYRVTDEWGQRFDIWHGYVCVEVPVGVVQSQ